MSKLKKIFNFYIKKYYYFFDNKLSDSSLVVFLIGSLIFLTGYLGSINNLNYTKSNLIEYKKNLNNTNIVIINGKRYKLILEELE